MKRESRHFSDGRFNKGRMSTGYAVLMDIDGDKIDFSNAPRGMKTPKMSNMQRISARKSWIICEQNRANSSHD